MNKKQILKTLDNYKGDDPEANLIEHTKKMIEMMSQLNDDLQEAGELFRFSTYEFAARTCVRTLFSELEAKMFLLHELILHMQLLSMLELSPEEVLLLQERSCSIGNNGRITTSQKFIPFKENLLFTLDLSARFFNKNVFRDTNDPKWKDVLTLIQIRNRITHPKRKEDLKISTNEVTVFNNAQDWLRKVFQSMLIDPDLLETFFLRSQSEKAKKPRKRTSRASRKGSVRKRMVTTSKK